MRLTNAQAEEHYNNLPKGSYGVQQGDYIPEIGRIVWGGSQWNLGTTELVAVEHANRWRQEGIELVIQREGQRIDVGPHGLPMTPERKAPFYKAVRLG